MSPLTLNQPMWDWQINWFTSAINGDWIETTVSIEAIFWMDILKNTKMLFNCLWDFLPQKMENNLMKIKRKLLKRSWSQINLLSWIWVMKKFLNACKIYHKRKFLELISMRKPPKNDSKSTEQKQQLQANSFYKISLRRMESRSIMLMQTHKL